MKAISFDLHSCCVCGQLNCNQAINHQRISLVQLKEIIMKNKKDCPEIDELKFSVIKKFYKLKKQLVEMVQKKEKKIIKWLDSFYFKHLEERSKVNTISILCDILQNDLRQLPNKNIIKVQKTLAKEFSKQSNEFNAAISTVKQDINEVLRSIEIPKILSEVNKYLKMQELGSFHKSQQKLLKSTDSVKTCHSTSSATNIKIQPQLVTPFPDFEWKHIKITQKLKTLQLNNRSINDQDMIKQIPIISTFTNIKQLEIRNNKITSLSCSIIANQMQFLTMIDLRGNKLGDQGMQKITLNLSNLKAFYISETGVTDKTGQIIAKNLPDLETLWAQHNQMSGQSCIKISQKPKLRLLSLIGNPVTQYHKSIIQTIFQSKGYLNI